MHKANLYSRCNGLQRRDADAALAEFVPLMEWRPDGGEVLLDVGCGPGDVTANVLLPRVSKVVRRVVGADVSDAMVRHAGDRYAGGSLAFAQLDIAKPILDPANLDPSILAHLKDHDDSNQGFHKIFSFFCLHWVQDQRRALHTIMRLLAPGGEILLVFLARSAVFGLYERLAEYPRWKPYMQSVEKFISPYHHSQDPSGEFQSLLESTGFSVQHCSCRHRFFEFDSMDLLMTSVMAVNPFLDRIPPAMHQTYIDDCRSEIERLKMVERVNKEDKDGPVTTRYALLVAHATKPSEKQGSDRHCFDVEST